MALNRLFAKRNLLFLLCCGVALFMFYEPLRELTKFSFRSGYYSHIWLIPLVSVYFFFTQRKTIFSNFEYLYRIGLPIMGIGIVLYFIGSTLQLQLNKIGVNQETRGNA